MKKTLSLVQGDACLNKRKAALIKELLAMSCYISGDRYAREYSELTTTGLPDPTAAYLTVRDQMKVLKERDIHDHIINHVTELVDDILTAEAKRR